MRIKSIKVDNFKSLVDFELPLAKFSCLVGLNSSGKSTILQLFDFLSQQVKGDISGWLKNRRWDSAGLNSKLTRKQNINFEILISQDNIFGDESELMWKASFNRHTLHCTSELIIHTVTNTSNNALLGFEKKDSVLLFVEDGEYLIFAFDRKEVLLDSNKSLTPAYANDTKIVSQGKIEFDYEGSLMAGIKESRLPEELRQLKDFLSNLHALDLLSPELLRQKNREASNSLGLGGEKLSAFLHGIGEEKRAVIQTKLAKIYPQFKNIDVSSLRSGWKSLTVQEQFGDTIIKTEARHVADGFLRMLAVFAQLSKEQSFLLLDEIENGVNPELIEFLIDELVGAVPQVLITTHSPMVLNYLEDDVAIEGIIYIYKNQIGATQAIRLFDLPRMREKLTVMGAGEVYEDTLLTQLNAEILGAD
jgi:predicted ATPase